MRVGECPTCVDVVVVRGVQAEDGQAVDVVASNKDYCVVVKVVAVDSVQAAWERSECCWGATLHVAVADGVDYYLCCCCC